MPYIVLYTVSNTGTHTFAWNGQAGGGALVAAAQSRASTTGSTNQGFEFENESEFQRWQSQFESLKEAQVRTNANYSDAALLAWLQECNTFAEYWGRDRVPRDLRNSMVSGYSVLGVHMTFDD